MIFLYKLFHPNCHPITFAGNVNLTIFSMLTPSSPFSLLLCLDIINKHSGYCHINGVIINFIAQADNRVVLKPSYFLDMHSSEQITFFFGSFELLLKLFNEGDGIK